MNKILTSLNESQQEAVAYMDGPELVIAGAGSGKTRVLTHKIAYLISQGMKPWNILALTFTNKAAREMKERIGSILGMDVARYVNMGTFHSVFLRILRVECQYVGLKPNFSIYDESDQKSIINSIIKELKLDDKIYKASSILSRIGMAKNNLITAERYASDGSYLESDTRSNMPKLGEIYRLYANRCLMANAVDFDDMLLFTYQLFASHPEICQKYATRFQYVLVDEYQDTNNAQQSIVTLLTKEHGNICVVGDDAQSIYAFRGANIDNILNFMNIYAGAKLFKLEQNYRSTQNIVGAANSVIEHNSRQIKKNVFSDNQQGDKVNVNVAYSDREEASIVCKEIIRLHKREGVDYKDIAILYRTNAQSRLLEEELRRNNVAYHIFGGMSFYQRKEIKDIVAYFRLIANTDDDEAFRRIVNYPKRGIGQTSVNKITTVARQHGVSIWSVIEKPEIYATEISATTMRKFEAFRQLMLPFIEQRSQMDIYALGKNIIEHTGITRDIFEDKSEEGKDRQENVEEFISGMHDFVDTKREEGYEDEVFIDNFLQELAIITDDRDSDNATQNDQVSLMTIHASKGLEFNAVFIVGVEENLFPSPRSCDSMRALEEERRLFYVAITRAEKHCYISCSKSRYQYGNMAFNEPSRFLKELGSEWITVNGRISLSRREYEDDVFSHRSNHSSLYETRTPSFRKPVFVKPVQLPTSQKTNINVKHSLQVGTRVEHFRFGIGVVTRVEGSGENEKATIDFENIGLKTLLLKFARLKVL